MERDIGSYALGMVMDFWHNAWLRREAKHAKGQAEHTPAKPPAVALVKPMDSTIQHSQARGCTKGSSTSWSALASARS